MRDSEFALPVAVAARDHGRATEFAARHALPHVFASYEALVDSDVVDAVYIPLPNHLHASWAIRALTAGKHVLVEKPFAMDATEVQQVLEVAAARRLVAMEAFMYRHHPQIDHALKLLQSGVLGELRLLRASFSVNLGNPEDFRWRRSMGGGSPFDIGCYCVNAILLFGGQAPQQTWSHIDRGSLANVPPEEFVDLNVVGGLEFDGFRGLFDCSFQQPNRQRLEVVGSHGLLELERPFLISEHDAARVIVNGEPYTLEPADRFRAMIDDFARAALHGEPLRHGAPASPAEPLHQMRALERLLLPNMDAF